MLKWWKRLQAVQDRVSVPFSEIPSSGQVTSNAGHCLAAWSAEGREEEGSFVIPAETVAAVKAWGIGVALAKWETMWVHRNRNRNHQGLESGVQFCLVVMACQELVFLALDMYVVMASSPKQINLPSQRRVRTLGSIFALQSQIFASTSRPPASSFCHVDIQGNNSRRHWGLAPKKSEEPRFSESPFGAPQCSSTLLVPCEPRHGNLSREYFPDLSAGPHRATLRT